MPLRWAIIAIAVGTATVVDGGEVRRWNAAELFDVGVSRGVTLSDDGKSLELSRGRLVHDDGPAAGYSYLPNEEKLVDGVAIRKQLVVDDPRAFETFLLVGQGGALEAVVNGKPQTLEPRGKAGNNWEQYVLPPEALRKGKNEIILRGSGKVWIARDDERPPADSPPPNRSAKSVDGGKTWNDARLGAKDDLDGEYYVRLYLDQHVPIGTITSAVIDQTNLKDAAVAPPFTGMSPVQVRVAADENASFTVWLRHGTTSAIDDKHWTSWRPLDGLDAEIPARRFVQFEVRFKTDDPRRSPKLQAVELEAATAAKPSWLDKVEVVEAPTTWITRSSIPFTFESPDHPKLKQLRAEHKLDDVIAGAKTEWETITKLAAWSGVRWEKRTGHLRDAYPHWDALEILSIHSDGTPVGGFCQQYNLVFLQACESFGIRGRPVSLGPGEHNKHFGGGHEVVELWSNDFAKWVHIDGDAARYYVDAKTRVPLSLLELHDRQLAALAKQPHEPVDCIVLADTRPAWTGIDGRPPFVELRMIPRSNFLAEAYPLPLNQGMRGWFWPGHEAWTDAQAPAARLYDHRVTSRSNWEWTLNSTEVRLLATETPGELVVDLDTATPGFIGYEATVDDGADAKPVENGFAWKLHPGVNRLVVRSRNETRTLIPTTAVFEWTP